MGIKVLFLYPNTYGMNMLPPAIATFSAILKKAGHTISVFDTTYYSTDHGNNSDGTKEEGLNVVPFSEEMVNRGLVPKKTLWQDDIKKQIEDFKPDLIALSTTEDMWELGIKLLKEVEYYIVKNKITVIAGGVFPTFAPDICIENKLIDVVCVGEGENALIDICKKIESKEDFSETTNCWIKKDGKVIKKNKITRPVDINLNPIIDTDIFEENRLYRPMAGKVYKMFPVETIRGCPFTCRFCNSPDQARLYKSLGHNFYRKKDMNLVREELKHFKDVHKVEYMYFWADTFLGMSKKELDQFIEVYSEINLPFWMQTRPETITDENISKLSKVGLHRISFGVEHGNEEFRAKILDRRWKNKDIIEKLHIPHKYGVAFSVNNITGFPTETKKLAFDTIELNRNIPADNANIYTFVPFHGTPLRKMCEELGFIDHQTITKCNTEAPQLDMPQYPPHEIEEIRKCFALYVKFPKNRWKEIERAEKNDEEGDKIYKNLKQEYLETYMPKPDADPHGGSEDFQQVENPYCSVPEDYAISDDAKRGYQDEMA
jgi:anaerobic magnesium-protoporphyrin IX monomethyl ester cyclase|tara:strand:+ start:750 stop:2384 length:1635 start_codon:yes stop_codon:yes gene_type:complete